MPEKPAKIENKFWIVCAAEMMVYYTGVPIYWQNQMCSYKAKKTKNVYLPSSMHHLATVDNDNPQKHSEAMLFYNTTKRWCRQRHQNAQELFS